MPNILIQALCDTFTKPKSIEEQFKKGFDTAYVQEKLVSQLSLQKFAKDLPKVVDKIVRIALEVYTEYGKHRAIADTKRKAKKAAATTTTGKDNVAGPSQPPRPVAQNVATRR